MAVEQTPDEPGIGDPGGGGGDGGGGGGGGNLGTIVKTLTIPKSQDASLLRVLVSADLSSPDDLQLIAYLTIGGVIRKVTPVNLIFDNRDSKAQGPLTMVTAVPGLPAGQYEATLSIRNLEPDGALTVKAGLYIEFVEIKRAAL
ncbi:MAG: hypothetical protein V3V60_16000 [Sphingomonas aquatilis]|uniref:hypothetical protein n=1 Tax=Sphingomonas aquatilis TaxID=93063 RepID=UPI002F34A31C